MKVFLDANFILTCARQKIDFESMADEILDEKIEWVTSQEVVNELIRILSRKGEKIKDKEAAKTGLEILENMNLKVLKLGKGHVDDLIVAYLKKNKCVLATLDKELKARVNCRILTIRGKKKLQII